MNTDGLSYVDSRIGVELADGSFIFTDECVETLIEISTGLNNEDLLSKPMRCRLAFIDIIKNAIVPIITHLEENKDDIESEEIFHRTMELVSILSQPMQCLMPKYGAKVSQQVEIDVNQLLFNTKREFLQPQLTVDIFAKLKDLTQPLDMPGIYLSETSCQSVDFSIYFYRNLLCIQDTKTAESEANMHIISLMFYLWLKRVVDQADEEASREIIGVSRLYS